jgi:zinc transport system substrate-binding protein
MDMHHCFFAAQSAFRQGLSWKGIVRAVTAVLVLMCGFFPCRAETARIQVIATIFPLQSFARAVGAEQAVVELLLPPGAEPHSWEPRPSDIVKLSQADVFLFVSERMEPWVPGVLRAADNRNLRVIQAGEEVKERERKRVEHHHDSEVHSLSGHKDPHVWLDFSYDRQIVDHIAAVFSDLHPDREVWYRQNAATYKEKLVALDARFRKGLADCARKEVILGGHAALGHLVKRYGLVQIPLYGFSPNAEPTPRKMSEVIALAKTYNAEAIFFEEFLSDKLARAIAQEVGAETLVLNPGANLNKEQIEAGVTFLSLMEQNLENLRNGLGCK